MLNLGFALSDSGFLTSYIMKSALSDALAMIDDPDSGIEAYMREKEATKGLLINILRDK